MLLWPKRRAARWWGQLFLLVLVMTLSGATANPSTTHAVIPDQSTVLQSARTAFYGPDLKGKDGPLQKIGFDLALLYTEFQAFQASAQSRNAHFQTTIPLLPISWTASDTFVTIDAIADPDVATLRTALIALGLQQVQTFGAVVSGQMPIKMLARAAALPSLRFARPAIAQTAAITGQSDRAITADSGRRLFGINGQGVTVGVLSDSYNCQGGAPADVASGDLPAGIMVLADETGCARGLDEGRAVMQLIADGAPGAQQAFHTAYGGQAAFANGILELASVAHATVIVDDVSYSAEPIFQDGIIAQAIDQVTAKGVTYISSAGNAARQSYESPFVGVQTLSAVTFSSGMLHDFDPGPGVDPFQSVTIPVGTTAVFALQWDQPYASATGGAGATSDLDLFLLDGSATPVASSIDKNIGRDPIEVLKYKNPGPNTNFTLAIAHQLGPQPHLLKYIYSGTGVAINEYATNSGTLAGHANAVGAMAVGAAFYRFTPAFGTNLPKAELFSSAGSTPILFDHTDTPIFQMRPKPEVVAPDGDNTTFFGKDIADPGDGSDLDSLPNFFGTSAAAAHVAAVAALLRAANPALTPAQIRSTLITTAIDMDAVGFDYNTGYGLVQAVPVLTQGTAHDLVSTQTSPLATALPGQPILYRLSFTNQGPNPAYQVIITNTLPTQVLPTNSSGQPIGAGVTLTALDPVPSARWQASTLSIGAGGIVTITGIVNPKLNLDTKLINRTTIASPADTVPANNVSQTQINVRVPRVQFAPTVAGGGQPLTVILDKANPYANVRIDYRVSNHPMAVETDSGAISGTLIIPRGQISTTLITSAEDQGYAQLIQSEGAMVGVPSVVALTPNLDSDGDSVLDRDEDVNADGDPTNDDTDGDRIANYLDPNDDGDNMNTRDEDANGNGSVLDDDTDGDGLPDYLDLVNTNPCIPRASTVSCQTDTDSDGSLNTDDPAPTDPCIPNVNALACTVGDTDGDDVANGEDVAPRMPCLPNLNAFACPTGDTDGDDVINSNDPAPRNACVPNAQALACVSAPQDACQLNALALNCLTGDADGDGVENGSDPAPLNPCLPTPNNTACQLSVQARQRLYLPLIVQ